MKIVYIIVMGLLGCVDLSAQLGDMITSPMRKIEFQVSSRTSVFKAGEPVVVNFLLTNKTDGEISFWRSTFFENHRVVIKRADGHEILMTDSGMALSRLFAPNGERSKNFCIKLAAGQADHSLSPLDLSQLYKFEPGRYFLNVYYEDAQCTGFSGAFFSNELIFDVK